MIRRKRQQASSHVAAHTNDGPQSLVGRYMMATILRDEARGVSLRSTFASVFPDGSSVQEVVGELVFNELARELFRGYGGDADIVRDFAAGIKGLLSASSSIRESDILSEIRGALDGKPRKADADPFDVMAIHIYFSMAAASQLGVTPARLGALFAEAEKEATARGVWLTAEDGSTSGLPARSAAAAAAAVPRDSRAVSDLLDDRKQFGSLMLRLPPRARISLVSREHGQIAAVEILSGETRLSLQVFAAFAPGLWDAIRSEMRDDIKRRAGTAVELDGIGWEIWAQYVRAVDGSAEIQQARIIGHEGPGWLLRGTFTWRGRWNPDDLAVLEQVYGDIIVVRGEEELPDRTALPLGAVE